MVGAPPSPIGWDRFVRQWPVWAGGGSGGKGVALEAYAKDDMTHGRGV